MKIPRFALVTALAALTASSIFGQSGFYLSAWEDPLMSWVEAANLIEGILP
jgi:branched-subunit amino acid transport protein